MLEPADEIGCCADELQPGAVGVEVTEREPFESGVLQAFDVVLDVGVVTHVGVEVEGGRRVVGVVTPVAVELVREQRAWAPSWNRSRRTISRVPSAIR